jgi:hypothetical protein
MDLSGFVDCAASHPAMQQHVRSIQADIQAEEK